MEAWDFDLPLPAPKGMVRVESNGRGRSRVVDDTGSEMPMVAGVKVEIPVRGPATAYIKVVMPHVAVVAEAKITEFCPLCGRHR